MGNGPRANSHRYRRFIGVSCIRELRQRINVIGLFVVNISTLHDILSSPNVRSNNACSLHGEIDSVLSIEFYCKNDIVKIHAKVSGSRFCQFIDVYGKSNFFANFSYTLYIFLRVIYALYAYRFIILILDL